AHQHIVGVDVQAALRKHEAHAEIVAAHCGVPASCKCGELARAIPFLDVVGCGGIAEHPEREAFVAQRIPTLQALADVRWYVAWVVPKPHQSSGYRSHAISVPGSRRWAS